MGQHNRGSQVNRRSVDKVYLSYDMEAPLHNCVNQKTMILVSIVYNDCIIQGTSVQWKNYRVLGWRDRPS